MRNVAILGVGQTNHARRRTDVSTIGLSREAVLRALEDADLTMDEISQLFALLVVVELDWPVP